MAFSIIFPAFTQTDRAVGWDWLPPAGVGIRGHVLATANALAQGSVVNVTIPGSFIFAGAAVPIPHWTMVVNNGAFPAASTYRAQFIDLP
jgi:hypothetical protein